MSDQDNFDSENETLAQLKALGYIDPGAGSSIWQVILASLLKISSKFKLLFDKVFSRSHSIEE